MRKVPNDIVTTLIRTLPQILDNMDEEAVRKKLRLNNAVRLTRIIIKRLKKLEDEQSNQHSDK